MTQQFPLMTICAKMELQESEDDYAEVVLDGSVQAIIDGVNRWVKLMLSANQIKIGMSCE